MTDRAPLPASLNIARKRAAWISVPGPTRGGEGEGGRSSPKAMDKQTFEPLSYRA